MKAKFLKRCVVLTAAISMLSMGIVASAEESYTVKTGDNLSKIAKEIYGDASMWRTIYEANKDSVKKSYVIYNGQILRIPTKTETVPVSAETEKSDFDLVENELPSPVPTETTEVTPEPITNETPITTPVQYIPIGVNPVVDGNGYETWTFTDGSWVTATRENNYNTVIGSDAYGVIYRECTSVLTNEEAMKEVSEFVGSNPKFADIVSKLGSQIVITNCRGLWDDESDYCWRWGMIECEPEACIYLYMSEDHTEDSWNELFTSIQDSISVE